MRLLRNDRNAPLPRFMYWLHTVFFLDTSKVTDLHHPVWKFGEDFQISSHRANVVTQGADLYIGTTFDLRYRGLVDVQGFRQLDLRHGFSLTQFVQRHFCD